MDDDQKTLADLIIKGQVKPGIPRFDSHRLLFAWVENGNVVFELDSNTVIVPFKDLTTDEARLAYEHYGVPETDTPEVAVKLPDIPVRPPNVTAKPDDSVSYDDSAVTGYSYQKGDENKGLIDAIFYQPPWYVMKWRLIFAAVMICIVFGIVLVTAISQIPVNNDKNAAISIAATDSSLQSFMSDKHCNADSEAFYYDPAASRTTDVRGNLMEVQTGVWVFSSYPDSQYNASTSHLSQVEFFYIIVDLNNKSIISSDHSTFMKI